jgi:hypothetical protein
MALFSFLLMVSCVTWLILYISKPANKVHYILIIEHTHSLIEWKIRRCLLEAWLHGTPMQLSVIDIQCSNDTIRVVEKLAFRYPISLYEAKDDNELQQIVKELTLQTVDPESYIIYTL